MLRFGRTTGSPAAQRWAAIATITLAAWVLAALPRLIGPVGAAMERADEFFYDLYYRMRPVESRADGEVVIVAVDQRSLDAVDKSMGYGWPWPRELWGHIVAYLDKAGARAVAFDILFSEVSAYQTRSGDDDAFADLLAKVKTPVVFGSEVLERGAWGRFAPPVTRPSFGAVIVGDKDKLYRRYTPVVNGRPSLAAAAVEAAGRGMRLAAERPFLLHYYGPHQTRDGRRTFHYVPAASVLGAQLQGEAAAKSAGVGPESFRGRIVLIGAIATGTYDLKSSPLSGEYPGVEIHATAIENLIAGQQVRTVSAAWRWMLPLVLSALATIGVVLPRRAAVKLIVPVIAAAAVLGMGVVLFRGGDIRWWPPVWSILATGLASLGAFSWAYFAEDRQRRFMLKALSKVVSPTIAEQLAREPQRLALGTIRTDLTVLFTDLANFTDISEAMDGDRLTEMLNRYLSEMSDQVLLHDGTLDKYIGDAIMCFWNAPLPQADHARRACRAALAIARREGEIQDELKSYGVGRIFTRIGINTASVAVGFIGSNHLYNYTALGDGVNLASRLEGANKLYGTRILLAESTAQLVREDFLLRQIDVLRVKGKLQPMAVYELMAEGTGDGPARELAQAYESALAMYRARQWERAREVLLELRARFADDGPSRVLLERVERMRLTPPADDWDGVYVAKEK